MSTRNLNIDKKLFLKNLQDLNNLSDKIIKEMHTKNQILESGIKECHACKKLVEPNHQRAIQMYQAKQANRRRFRN